MMMCFDVGKEMKEGNRRLSVQGKNNTERRGEKLGNGAAV